METVPLHQATTMGEKGAENDTRKKMAMVEASLFMAGRPMSLKELSESVGMTRKPTLELVRSLVSDYEARGSALEIFIDEGRDYAGMRVRNEYLPHVRDLSTLTDITDGEKKTLAIVAFYQPIRQSEIIKIRGNRCYNQLRKLEGAGLVRAEPKGSTKMLTTTRKFTEYFGNMDVEKIKKQLEGKHQSEEDGGAEAQAEKIPASDAGEKTAEEFVPENDHERP